MKLIKTLTASCVALGFSFAASAQNPPAAPAAQPVDAAPAPAAPVITDEQKLELFGWLMVNAYGVNQLDLTPAELETVKKGISLGMAGNPAPYDVNKVGPEMQSFLMGKNEAYRAKAAVKAKAEAETYFAKLKTQPGIQSTASGLCYEIIQPGTGAYPKASDTVKVHYTGKLLDGTTFDSSVDRGEPIEFPLSGVIPGWTEGLQKINKGGKLKLYIPGNLGYGEQGSPPRIPPNATLVFDVELLDIVTPPLPAAPVQPPAPSVAPAPGK